jgi:integrase
VEEKAGLLTDAKARRSHAIHPALMLALHAGMRDAEMRGLQWARLDLHKAILTVGDSKTDAGQGRTIPLKADVLATLEECSRWYAGKFGKPRPEWYVFPFGKPQPTDPTRPATTFRTVWAAVKEATGISGWWHHSRYTFITDLAESGEAGDETIRDLGRAGLTADAEALLSHPDAGEAAGGRHAGDDETCPSRRRRRREVFAWGC